MDQAQKEQKDWAFLLPFFISGASVGAHKFPPFNTPTVIEIALPKQYIVHEKGGFKITFKVLLKGRA